MPLKNPLTPRETALRLLEHMEPGATYDDIIRQVRILEDIEQTMNDVELYGFEAEDVVEAAREEVRRSGESKSRHFRAVRLRWDSLEQSTDTRAMKKGWVPLSLQPASVEAPGHGHEPHLWRAAWLD